MCHIMNIQYFSYFELHSHKPPKKTQISNGALVKPSYIIASPQIPEIEGPLWLKSEGKKSWKKYYFVLRPNGLYHATKPGGKVASARYVCLNL